MGVDRGCDEAYAVTVLGIVAAPVQPHRDRGRDRAVVQPAPGPIYGVRGRASREGNVPSLRSVSGAHYPVDRGPRTARLVPARGGGRSRFVAAVLVATAASWPLAAVAECADVTRHTSLGQQRVRDGRYADAEREIRTAI